MCVPRSIAAMKITKTLALCTFYFYAASFTNHFAVSLDMDCGNVWRTGNLDQPNSPSTSTIRLTILHREHPCAPASKRPVRRSPSALQEYHTRVRRLANRLSSCPADEATASGLIFANGVPWDYYSYVTQVQLGTPAKTHNVLVDTASSLSWVGCEPCINACLIPTFNPNASSTYKVVGCGSALCNAVPSATMARKSCMAPTEGCSYRQSYHDYSLSVGVVSSDTLTYGLGSQKFIFGCCNLFRGVGGRYSGILGMSVNKFSLFSQMTVGHRYRAMSYCFPHPRNQGFLQFGRYDEHKSLLRFTPLYIDGNNYFVHVSNVMVETMSLDVQSSGNQTMRCFFDTGTPYTMLPQSLFVSLSDTVGNLVEGYYRVGASTGQTCFQADGNWIEGDLYMPTVKIEFQNGARITLNSEDLMFMEEPNVFCLAFKMNDGGDIVLGSRHLMGVHTVVDLEMMTMGLRGQGCN
ncbi:aspartyl protease family protein At5g10770-like [Hordeum vulgare subsp. vulgare]|uniref:Predicted protein n=1 Tax=Hordeum vulgare subsp. vulgare TaxID=112509 RepID=F2E9F7_HORVV|nr:aspartyl protease family protein At5g10770-like [Hordeum vulgare subsp. vulgare]BAK03979.1 predicted protein [Hordeum vulgare subsp. vulgare]